MNIDIARAHIRVREEQRVRSERVINITVCVERALAVAPLTHLETRSGANDRERGGAATTAPAAGDPKHLRDLEQIDDTTEHARAERDTNR